MLNINAESISSEELAPFIHIKSTQCMLNTPMSHTDPPAMVQNASNREQGLRRTINNGNHQNLNMEVDTQLDSSTALN